MELAPQSPLIHRLLGAVRRAATPEPTAEVLWPADERPSAERARERARTFLDSRRESLREQLAERTAART